MDRSTILEKYGRTPENRLLLAHLCDRAVQAENTHIVTSSAFLDPAGRVLVTAALAKTGINFAFFGGYENAERTVCLFAPDHINLAEYDKLPICALRFKLSGGEPTHRDFLGALMSIGIKRETVGDILVYPGGGDIIIMNDIADFICYNLKSVGRFRAEVRVVPLEGLYLPEPKTKTVHDTVSSLRVDAVLCGAFSLSRSEAADFIRAGRVSVNFRVCENPSQALAQGDMLSLRGSGRAMLQTVGSITKKRRIPIDILKYV